MTFEYLGGAALKTAIPKSQLGSNFVDECDIPEEGLSAGAVGTIVDILQPEKEFMVEFVDKKGYTISVISLMADQLIPLND